MTFNSALHPRGAKGTPTGGQFAAGASGSSGPAKTSPHAGAPKSGTHPMAGHGAGKLTKTLAYDAKSGRGPGYGVKGGDPHVRQLQEALNRLGATDHNGKRLGQDGDLGPLTTSAIVRAQKALGLRADGKVTPSLFEALLRARSLPGIKPPPTAAHVVHHAPVHHAPTHTPAIHHPPTPPRKPMAAPKPPPGNRFTHASARSMDAAPMGGDMTGSDMEQQLMDLLAGLSDDELNELAALAEAMHADGGN